MRVSKYKSLPPGQSDVDENTQGMTEISSLCNEVVGSEGNLREFRHLPVKNFKFVQWSNSQHLHKLEKIDIDGRFDPS